MSTPATLNFQLPAPDLSAWRAVLIAAASGLLEPLGALLGVGLTGGLAAAYPAGLGLDVLSTGAFKDNAAINDIVTALNGASSTLRSQASAFGSNLSIVQIRQDFSKNLINVLQTGSTNLTIADTNEEAANSQALSTRQSIAGSALALANQSQQSVLQLRRT